ncbi:hypothetical protein HJB53_30340 [Rhizobium lentis]|uniref:hypothetical protein n=1 Tax=Rhizobium lentis TaxID=1138194 RepID=UPI001C82A27E|nr:hypothetical protein [Rhizobium lentis]MBX5130792.1 hypothetical protein [Rhizobium lentis]
MHLETPISGEVVYLGGPLQIVSAPINAKIFMGSPGVAFVNDKVVITDEVGTTLTYRVISFSMRYGEHPTAYGTLESIEHAPVGVISIADHDTKVSSAIDIAFEGGRQVGRQETMEAFQAEQRQRILAAVEVAADEAIKDALYRDLVFVKATAPFAYKAEEPLPKASFHPFGAMDKGEAAACACGPCEAARDEPAERKPLWKPRYGPVGNRLDDD